MTKRYKLRIPDGSKVESVRSVKADGKDVIIVLLAPEFNPKPGDLCIFWSISKKEAIVAIYVKKVQCAIFDNTGFFWSDCIKFKSEEQFRNFIKSEQ